jgi:hypothetical protein
MPEVLKNPKDEDKVQPQIPKVFKNVIFLNKINKKIPQLILPYFAVQKDVYG